MNMEMEQMMERLLARMDIKQGADRKADQEKMAANRKADRNEVKAIMNAFQEKMDSYRVKAAKQEGMPNCSSAKAK
jgi:hypothetical protein